MKFFMVMLFSVSAFSAIQDSEAFEEIASLRKQTMNSIAFVKSSPMTNCFRMSLRAINVERSLVRTERTLLDYDEQQANPKLARLFSLLKSAKNEAPGLNIDCANGTRNSQILLEMYLTNIDTELMILQYGVGANLKRAQ